MARLRRIVTVLSPSAPAIPQPAVGEGDREQIGGGGAGLVWRLGYACSSPPRVSSLLSRRYASDAIQAVMSF